MPLPTTGTTVDFPRGAVQGRARVRHVLPSPLAPDRRLLLITDSTPFHPLGPTPLGQPGDTGELDTAGRVVPVLDSVTVAAPPDRDIAYVGRDIPAHPAGAGWRHYVGHVVSTRRGGARSGLVGARVTLRVDPRRRLLLSAGHTGHHLASLALNAALTPYWREATVTDGLGSPDFDGLALRTYRIHPGSSTSTYRIGVALRERGFDATGLDAALADIEERANTALAAWHETGAPVLLRATGPFLDDRRVWSCALPPGRVEIPCAGTHVRGLDELERPSLRLRLDEEGTLLVCATRTIPIGFCRDP
ncbi:metal-dependent hydrolase [Marinactinospora thermotolerans]|uniref:Alanyl-tRNA synthetase n=1 Tax=Marinactinospora thermotolerans DSM 45154 TaxID=1122192 RepID=A0A1T4LFT9_9ACTN|nr:hypothetical protein [Marinactinospora thermotolerans]SJZ53491.1 alanyl-tRNA synthetase [Marinactinospora thermotolerans DSM 45154]